MMINNWNKNNILWYSDDIPIMKNFYNKISKLFELRTTEGITTTLIFYILYLFNKIYHVETVRIIDESCNAELDKSKQVYYEKLDGTWVTNYRALSKEAIKPLAENIGYGGKKKKNRNRNRTRKK